MNITLIAIYEVMCGRDGASWREMKRQEIQGDNSPYFPLYHMAHKYWQNIWRDHKTSRTVGRDVEQFLVRYKV